MKISGVHLSRKVRWLSLGWCHERYTCMAEMHTISLNISQNGNPHNQCSVVDQPPNCENGAFFKVVKCFEIVTDFCSPGTSLFLLAGPCPVSLAFLHTWPQGRCERTEERGVTSGLLSHNRPGLPAARKDSCALAVDLEEYLLRECLSLETWPALSGLQGGGKLQQMWWELRCF